MATGQIPPRANGREVHGLQPVREITEAFIADVEACAARGCVVCAWCAPWMRDQLRRRSERDTAGAQ